MEQILHRGPDAGEAWLDEHSGLTFGFRRLAIRDVSANGMQPMQSQDGRYVIVFNGEIYNASGLKKKMEDVDGYRDVYRGTSDTEILLNAFCHYGVKKTLAMSKGMFGIALYDRQEKILYLMRDRYGEKPLFYGRIHGKFVFASELGALVFTLAYFYIVCKKELSNSGKDIDTSKFPTPASAITDKTGFGISCGIFALAVVLLVTHATTGLTVATIGLGIAIITLITSPRHIPEIMSRVDYKTILFFIGLFVVVGGLEETGILVLIAGFISKISNGNVYLMIAIIIWVSAIASAFIDNIPFAATMIPVIQSLAGSTGVSLETMSWALSMGTDIGGSATPIGASANVVGTSVVAKAGHPVGWGKYCKMCVPATVIVMIISTVFIFVRYL